MRLLLNYKRTNKILSDFSTYADIAEFVNSNFSLPSSDWNLVYIDSEQDVISLGSDLDIQTMLETMDQERLKVYIKDNSQQQFAPSVSWVQSQISQKNKASPYLITQEPQKSPEKPQLGLENDPNTDKLATTMLEKKMAQFFDERIQAIMPVLTQKISERLKNPEKVQNAPMNEKTIHDIVCTGCGVFPIRGIRYMCPSCKKFNYCSECEEKFPHDHNMIKMKFVEDKESDFSVILEKLKPEFGSSISEIVQKIEEKEQKAAERPRSGWGKNDNNQDEDISKVNQCPSNNNLGWGRTHQCGWGFSELNNKKEMNEGSEADKKQQQPSSWHFSWGKKKYFQELKMNKNHNGWGKKCNCQSCLGKSSSENNGWWLQDSSKDNGWGCLSAYQELNRWELKNMQPDNNWGYRSNEPNNGWGLQQLDNNWCSNNNWGSEPNNRWGCRSEQKQDLGSKNSELKQQEKTKQVNQGWGLKSESLSQDLKPQGTIKSDEQNQSEGVLQRKLKPQNNIPTKQHCWAFNYEDEYDDVWY